MNFNNFWSNVSKISIGEVVSDETVKEIAIALKAVESKQVRLTNNDN